jgi:hypothetical protein
MVKNVSLFSATRFLYVIIVLFLSLVSTSIAEKPDHFSIRVQEGLKLVETFYTFLLSDTDIKECPDILTNYYYGSESAKGRKKALKSKWAFYRNNKELFLFPYRENEPSHEIEDIMKLRGYFFMNPPPWSDCITEGHLFIVLISGTGYPDGLYKQIFFPIEYDKRKQSYAISSATLKINGIFVDNYFDRDFDLFERLGFKKQKSNKD